VWERLRDLKGESGTTILLTTHDMEEADALCDRLAVMHQGSVVLLGEPDELRASIGPEATLADVFIRSVGGSIDEGGTYRDTSRLRSAVRRRG
jgi:ABC-2 type transport system ATP-binding protein